jgi:hypothetical protein
MWLKPGLHKASRSFCEGSHGLGKLQQARAPPNIYKIVRLSTLDYSGEGPWLQTSNAEHRRQGWFALRFNSRLPTCGR